MTREKQRWLMVVVFALAMAWLESAAVLYLRTLVDRLEPHQVNPLPMFGGLGLAEVVREAATLIMLSAVGWLAGSNWRTRIAYATLAFGVWDIFYYVFLRLICPWPKSVFDWDLLFLLPLPWWGPVLAPAAIALLMCIGGTLVSQFDREDAKLWPRWPAFAVGACGTLLALYTFMADSIRVAPQGAEALRKMLPSAFNWPLFLLALGLMTAPIVEISWRLLQRKSAGWQQLGAEAVE